MGAVRFSGRRKSNEMKGSTICGRGDGGTGDDFWHNVARTMGEGAGVLVVVVDKDVGSGCELIIARRASAVESCLGSK